MGTAWKPLITVQRCWCNINKRSVVVTPKACLTMNCARNKRIVWIDLNNNCINICRFASHSAAAFVYFSFLVFMPFEIFLLRLQPWQWDGNGMNAVHLVETDLSEMQSGISTELNEEVKSNSLCYQSRVNVEPKWSVLEFHLCVSTTLHSDFIKLSTLSSLTELISESFASRFCFLVKFSSRLRSPRSGVVVWGQLWYKNVM